MTVIYLGLLANNPEVSLMSRGPLGPKCVNTLNSAIRTPEPAGSRAPHIPLLGALILHECLPLQFENHSYI